jgi:hypothetical protein
MTDDSISYYLVVTLYFMSLPALPCFNDHTIFTVDGSWTGGPSMTSVRYCYTLNTVGDVLGR